MSDRLTSSQQGQGLFKVLLQPSTPHPNFSSITGQVDDGFMRTADVGAEGKAITSESPTPSTSRSVLSNTASNDLSISYRHFEKAKMADNCKWDDKCTAAFIFIMHENIDELSSSSFKTSMFNKMADDLCSRTGVPFTASQLSTKFQRLRNEWRKYTWLLKQTGLGIHPSTGAILATDEQWKALEDMQEGVSKFCKVGLPHYDQLTQLFSKSTAVGTCARSASVAAPNSNEEREIQQHLKGEPFAGGSSVRGQYRDTTPSHSTEPSKSSGKRKFNVISPDSGDGSGKKSKGTSTVEMLTQLWATKELKRESKKDAAYEDNDPFSIPKAMKILNAINVDPNLYYRVVHVLCDHNMRQVFMTMTPELRYGFLASL